MTTHNFIFEPINDKVKSQSTEYYCMLGDQDYLDDNNFPRVNQDSQSVLAKKIKKDNDPPQFYIKISNQNKLFNPLDGGLIDKSYSIIDNVCRPSDKFKTVNMSVFNLYLNFLSSKNLAWLTKAEREMI